MSQPTAEQAAKSLSDLIRWVEVWNRVCATAWGDDDKPPPSWAKVVEMELSGWKIGNMTADGWDAYMKQRLYHKVETYLYHLGVHPYQTETPSSAITSSQEQA